MPYDDPDPQDPLFLVGVELPADPASQLEMACAFAEEFARSGYGAAQILALFEEPFYAGAHRAFLDLGEETVAALVNETVAVWGRIRLVDKDSESPSGADPCREQKPFPRKRPRTGRSIAGEEDSDE